MTDLLEYVREQQPRYFAKWLGICLSTKTDRFAVEDAYTEACFTSGQEPSRLVWNPRPIDLGGLLREYIRPSFISEAIVQRLGAIGSAAGLDPTHLDSLFVGRALSMARLYHSGGFVHQAGVSIWSRGGTFSPTQVPMIDLLLDYPGPTFRTAMSSNDLCHLEAIRMMFLNCATILGQAGRAVALSRPIERHMCEKGLHNDHGPALVYDDGRRFFALNGIIVPPEVVLCSPDELDPQLVLGERNAEVRREIVKRMGLDRLLRKTRALVLDKWRSYELVELKLGDGGRAPYLRMENPSTGEWHVEGVDPACKTVKEALAWRNHLTGDYIIPEVLT